MGQATCLVSTEGLQPSFNMIILALYVHCVSHVLNLCVVAACRIQAIRNMYGVVEEICLFFNYSPKQQQELQEHVENLPVGNSSKTKLVNLCKTRWVAQIEAFEVFRDMLPALVCTLEVISTAHGWSAGSSKKKASALLISITQFLFLMSLEVTWAGLGFIKGLTISLQGQKDICCAYNEIVTVKEALSEVRGNIDTYHKELYDSVVSLGGKSMHCHLLFHGDVPTRRIGKMCLQTLPRSTLEEQ